jgi:hypothetical protein
MEVRIYFTSGNRITIDVRNEEYPVFRHEISEIPEIYEIEVREEGRYIWSVISKEELEEAK